MRLLFQSCRNVRRGRFLLATPAGVENLAGLRAAIAKRAVLLWAWAVLFATALCRVLPAVYSKKRRLKIECM